MTLHERSNFILGCETLDVLLIMHVCEDIFDRQKSSTVEVQSSKIILFYVVYKRIVLNVDFCLMFLYSKVV